jgi:hypothetical protein
LNNLKCQSFSAPPLYDFLYNERSATPLFLFLVGVVDLPTVGILRFKRDVMFSKNFNVDFIGWRWLVVSAQLFDF